MSNDDFDALVTLIRNMIRYEAEMRDHPRDGPRLERAYREQEEAIDTARSILVV